MRLKVDLAAAVAAAVEQPAAPLTVAELVRGFAVTSLNDYDDLRLRKWLDAFGSMSTWAITPEQLDAPAQVLLAAAYKPSTVNRDLSSLGSAYRWAMADLGGGHYAHGAF
jgi:site-specific recombinase XerD